MQKILKYKFWLLLLLIIAVAAYAGNTYVKTKTKPAFTGTVITVERGDIQAAISATGTISAVNSVDISSRITGLITSVKVNENDMVKAGQVLIILDDTALRTQVNQAKAQMLNTAATYERSQRLAAVGAISAQQLDADRTSYLIAQASYENSSSQLEYTIISAPIDGRVIGKPIPAGQTVAQGISSPMVLMTIADLSKMQIQVQVDESDIGRVQLKQKVNFTVDAYPGKTFTGTVSLISQKASIQQNVVYYTVYVDIDSSEGLLYPTMTARVNIQAGESKNVLVVPLSAIKEMKGQKFVQVMVDNQQQSRPVQLGLSDDEKTAVLQGLNEGDKVVLQAKPQQQNANNTMMPPPPIMGGPPGGR